MLFFGKGDKERIVYFDARTKLHLQEYLNTRKDNDKALFVGLRKPYRRVTINGIELRIRQIGREVGIKEMSSLISSEGRWQQLLLIRECLWSSYRNFLDMKR